MLILAKQLAKSIVTTRQHYLAPLCIFVLTFFVYFPAIQADFVMDDQKFYLDDPLMTAPDGLFRIWFHPLDNNNIWPYLPLTRTAFWLERQFNDPVDLRITHGVNILLHACAAMLLWGVLQARRMPGAGLAGILFAVHPIYVQSVAWIAERKNGMAGIFFILCFWSFFRFLQTRKLGWYALTLGVFVGAVLSKTSTVMIPILLIGMQIWFLYQRKGEGEKGRGERGEAGHGVSPLEEAQRILSKIVLPMLPFFGVAVAAGMMRVWVETEAFGAAGEEFLQSFGERLLLAGQIPFFYLQKMVLPYPLIFSYPRWPIELGQFGSYLPLLSIAITIVVLGRKLTTWGRPLFLALGSFLVLLFPVLGFFNNAWFRHSWVADHWVHLPSIPLIILASYGWIKGWEHWGIQSLRLPKWGSWVGGSCVVLILGWLTFQQTQIYRNYETLWLATLKHNPNSWLAYYNLGTMHLDAENYEPALHYFDQALQVHPKLALAYTNRGRVHMHYQQYEQALREFNTALGIDPRSFRDWANRGDVYFHLGQYQQALHDYDTALKIKPEYVKVHNNKGIIYLTIKQHNQALDAFNLAIQYDSTYSAAYVNRGQVYSEIQRLPDACQDWAKACQLGDCRVIEMDAVKRLCP